MNRMYAERRAAGLCAWCAQPMPEGDSRGVCPQCRQKKSELGMQRTQYRKDHGLCIKCGQPNDRMPDQFTCTACSEKDAAKKRARREQWMAAGLCSVCGKRLAAEGRIRCQTCIDKDRQRSKEDHDWWVAHGRCGQCGRIDTNTQNGRHTCAYCIYLQSRSHRKRRMQRQEETGAEAD